ncbi:hypothetical protein K501DRAFT_141221, partial [Backusella circina FSU 941]
NNSLCLNVQKLVQHTRDIDFLIFLFANYFCLKRLTNGQDIPVLNQLLVYNLSSLTMGLGGRVNTNVKASFRSFKKEIDNFLDLSLFATQGSSTAISSVMRSYVALI